MSITCPVCGMTSYSPVDIQQGWCGNCHQRTSPPGMFADTDDDRPLRPGEFEAMLRRLTGGE